MGKRLYDFIDSCLEVIFPSNIYCICCGSMIDNTRPYALCDHCVRKFHWNNGKTCAKCGKALQDNYYGKLCYDCMMYNHYFTKGYSCLTYGLYEREVIMDYKYNGKGYIGRKFGDILYDRMSCEDITPDVIIPVPISAGRMKKRGYNQAALMAKRLAHLWNVRYDETSLIRSRETELLRSLNPAERQTMLEGAFDVTTRGKHRLKDKEILLVDDIYTTGTTLDSCSKTLLDNGAAEVYVLTLASGGNRMPSIG